MQFLARVASLSVLIFAFTNINTSGQQRAASVWVTTSDRSHLLARTADVPIQPDDGTAVPTLELTPAQAYQRILGFGASLTESSAYLLRTMPSDAARQALLDKFFNVQTGAGLRVLRQPIGASDFALDHYSYNDLPAGQTDLTLQRFSIDRDRQYVLPALKEALQINPDMVLIASPWSAPGWMKTSGAMIGGSLRKDRYGVFADYLVKFLKAYETEGISFDFLTVANEPLFVPNDYPGMYMPAVDQAAFFRDHVGPAFTRAALPTKLLTFDQNWRTPEYPLAVLDDSGARPHVGGVAFHCYSGVPSMMDAVHNAYPDRPIHVTECSSFSTGKTFGANLLWNARVLVMDSLRHWAESVVAWNLVLDENGGPRTGGCVDCTGLATINSTGAVSFNGEYYALAHAAAFIKPGARRIATTGFDFSDLEGIAVKNPDGSYVMLMTNSGIVARRVKLRLGSEVTFHQLPAGSVTTVVWPASGPVSEPTFDNTPVPGLVEAENFGNGGRGVSYFDLTAGNIGGQYRVTDVDIEATSDTGGGYNVGWLRPGEWLAYPLEVSTSETYAFEIRVASQGAGGTFHIEIDGVDRTGPLRIPDTGAWQTWVTLRPPNITLNAGRRIMRLLIDAGGASGDAGNINFIRVSRAAVAPVATPYAGTPAPIPGPIEAEHFDNGGSGIAFRDLTSQNYGGVFRNTGVDIETTVGGYNVGWTQAGEWLQYTAQVATAGTYTATARVASAGQGGAFHLEIAGVDVSGPLVIPDTGGWQVWRTISTTVVLTAGTHPIRVVFDGNGLSGYAGNLDSLTFGSTVAPVVNLALGKPATASSMEAATLAAPAAVDGKSTTRWSSGFSDPQWITVDLGATHTIQHIVLRWETAYARSYQLQVSDDGSTWRTVYSTTSSDGAADDVRNLNVSGRFVRMYGLQRATVWGYSLWEFEVHGPAR